MCGRAPNPVLPATASESLLRCCFPFLDGIYFVGHGGAHFLVNHHYRPPSHRYALDILQINLAGFSRRGILPDDLAAYQIFERVVCSPCDGLVTAAFDLVEDLSPPIGPPSRWKEITSSSGALNRISTLDSPICGTEVFLFAPATTSGPGNH